MTFTVSEHVNACKSFCQSLHGVLLVYSVSLVWVVWTALQGACWGLFTFEFECVCVCVVVRYTGGVSPSWKMEDFHRFALIFYHQKEQKQMAMTATCQLFSESRHFLWLHITFKWILVFFIKFKDSYLGHIVEHNPLCLCCSCADNDHTDIPHRCQLSVSTVNRV